VPFEAKLKIKHKMKQRGAISASNYHADEIETTNSRLIKGGCLV